MQNLSSVLSCAGVLLEPFASRHIDGLRSACAEDSDIWEIYPVSMSGSHFDTSVQLMENLPDWVCFAIIVNDRVVGMTCYIPTNIDDGSIGIGFTYIIPSLRGKSINRQAKRLLINHAFSRGYDEIQFSVDTRNKRSMRAVEKLGARLVSIQEKDMTTWTGYTRDTAVFRLSTQLWNTSEAVVREGSQ